MHGCCERRNENKDVTHAFFRGEKLGPTDANEVHSLQSLVPCPNSNSKSRGSRRADILPLKHVSRILRRCWDA